MHALNSCGFEMNSNYLDAAACHVLMIIAATMYSSSHSATQVWLMLTVTSHMSLCRIKWKLNGCFRHVQSQTGRFRPAVQTGQQLSNAVLCTTGHVVRCFCDSNGPKLYDSSHQGHYNIVRKLASWSGPTIPGSRFS